MTFEVSDVLEDDVGRLTLLPSDDFENLMEQGPTSPIPPPILVARLGEGLTRKASAEDLVIRDQVSRGSDVPVHHSVGNLELMRVEVARVQST
jgi:hypothetical protein